VGSVDHEVTQLAVGASPDPVEPRNERKRANARVVPAFGLGSGEVMAALADYLGLEKSTMTGLVDRAEKRGLLARAPSAEDGRATEVFLTNEGTRLVERLYLEVKQELAPLMDRLDPPSSDTCSSYFGACSTRRMAERRVGETRKRAKIPASCARVLPR